MENESSNRHSSPGPTFFPGGQSLVYGELTEQTTGYPISSALREPEPSDDLFILNLKLS